MPIQIFEHSLADLYFDEAKAYFVERWKPATKDANDDDYINFQLQKIEWAKKSLPKLFLCDTKNLFYTITLEMQVWTDENVTRFWDNTPLEKVAFIVSSEFIAQLSLEQLMDESTHQYKFAYFDSEEKATNWLFSE